MTADHERRVELGAFLRARRERITPESVGLPGGGRRRTPGLRREEVAQLAGVGVTWYTWLEQARDINVSPPVLDAIARALRLDQRERAHLFTLSATVDLEAEAQRCSVLAPGYQRFLDQLDPFPAVALSWRYDILAFNTAYRFLRGDLVDIPPEERNFLWLFFTHPDYVDFVEDRENGARHAVARFRTHLANHLGDPLAQELVGRLLDASPFFAELWPEHDVAPDEPGHKVFPTRVGRLRVLPQRLLHSEGDGWTMVYTPADQATAGLLPKLLEAAPQTRVAVSA
ncbi:MAG TPA: helix-turn-helix transcriptional regulator [Nocardioides sp.]|jgi:transcriptional regulator with XRE-family HTH domain|nr:helix-turn-helix transcriptional regulator [Nocardioides sp.]